MAIGLALLFKDVILSLLLGVFAGALFLNHWNPFAAFGRTIADFQNTRFKLAEAKTEATVCRTFTDHCIALHMEGALDTQLASMAKLHSTETACRVLDECLQLFGGYGYMWEYPVARAWADARVQRIYGGTSEIMKELIARTL